MKQIIFICSLFILLQVSFNANSATNNSRNRNQTDSIKCEIKGSVINRPESKEAIIIEALRDQRVNKHFRVPIIDGKYSFTLRDDFPRCILYFLTMKNAPETYGSEIFIPATDMSILLVMTKNLPKKILLFLILKTMILQKLSLILIMDVLISLCKIYMLQEILYIIINAHI